MISGRAAIGIAVVMMVLSFAVLVPGNSVPATRAINTGDGLSGGGDLDDDLTLVSDLAATLVGGVTTSASGLQFVSADFGLLTCASGEIQKTTAALAWECSEIEDIYLFDDGDVGTGTFDFGGADDFELPNATNGTTVDTDGQITIDLRSSTTTAPSINVFTSSTEWALPLEDEHGLLLLSATTTDDFPLMTNEYPIEVIEVCMLALGGQTWTGNLVEYDENGANPTDLFTDKTVGATRQCINTFTDDDIAARGWIGIDTTSVSATVTTLHISWRFRVKPER